MSMISAQCDELRAMAESVWLAMPQAATLMMDAADTIDELRDMMHRERDKNAKLRKLLLDVWNDAMQFDGFWDYVNDDGEIYNEDELPHYYERMRELGLEVR